MIHADGDSPTSQRHTRTTASMIEVDPIGEDDWRTLRDVRLQALAEAPYAFWSTHADELVHTEAQWRQFLRAAAFYVAHRGGQVVGIAAGLPRQETTDELELVAMWVAPDERRRGTATLLTRELISWAESQQATAMTLWVTDGNTPARKLYENVGFTPTGERGVLPHTAGTGMERMRLSLDHTAER